MRKILPNSRNGSLIWVLPSMMGQAGGLMMDKVFVRSGCTYVGFDFAPYVFRWQCHE